MAEYVPVLSHGRRYKTAIGAASKSAAAAAAAAAAD